MNEKFISEKVNQAIVARNNEIEKIKKCYDRVLDGDSEICIIAGAPGIGKTFLVEHAVKELGFGNITYICGKFKQYDDTPLSAISEIIEQIVRHLLTLPSNQLDSTKKALKKALGTNIDIITSISTYARKFLGQQKNINVSDYEKRKYKVRNTIHTFISTVAQTLFPLIIFIDDIQWADMPSLEVIKLIGRGFELMNILLILSYRDNEVKNNEKIKWLTETDIKKNLYKHIKLQALSENDTKKYIQLNFSLNIESIEYLTRIIFSMTLGNPFYINEILDIFLEDNILVQDEEKHWILDINHINRINLPNNLEQIISERVNRLGDEEKYLLELISCLDGKAGYELLKTVSKMDLVALERGLKGLCDTAFLMKEMSGGETKELVIYTCIHDIILEIVYKSIEPVRKGRLHFEIAENLIECEDKSFINDNRLFMASQLLRSEFNLIKKQNAVKWVNELYLAGLELKQSTAIGQALKMFEYCGELLESCGPREKEQLGMTIGIELGECLFICKKYNEAADKFEELLTRCNNVNELVGLKTKHMNLYVYNGNLEKAIELGLEVLKHLTFGINIKYLGAELFLERLLLTESRINKLEGARTIEDERILYILETLTRMAPAAKHINEKLFNLILLKIGNISVKYGNSPYSAIGYTAYSFILYNVWMDYKKGKRLTDITLRFLNDGDNMSSKPIAYFLMGTYIYHWSNPFKHCIKYLEKSIDEGVLNGELLYSGYSMTSIVNIKYTMGIPLGEILHYIGALKKITENGI